MAKRSTKTDNVDTRAGKYSTASRIGLSITPKVIKRDAKAIETSRNSIFIRPLLTALATDIAGLEWSCEGEGWQKALYDKLQKKLTSIIAEMVVWGWAYGEAHADCKWELSSYNGDLYNVPTDYVCVDMSKFKASDDQTITIDKTVLPRKEILSVQLFTEAGAVISMGQMYSELIQGLEYLMTTWTQSTGANALGSLVLTQSNPGLISSQAMNDINVFMDGHGKYAGSSALFPPGVSATILASPAKPDFEKPIGYAMFLLLSSIRSQWAMASITSPGTYGTTESQRSSYQTFINNLADLVADGLNEHFSNIAKTNLDFQRVEIVHSKAADTKSLGSEFMAALRGIVELTPFFNDEQKKALYSMLGIPEPVPAQILPIVYPQTTQTISAPEEVGQASKSLVSARLKGKKSAVYNELLKRIERVKQGETGLAIHLTISGADDLARDMNITAQQLPDFKMIWKQFQEAVNSLIKMYDENDDIDTAFERIWQVFELGVLKWAK